MADKNSVRIYLSDDHVDMIFDYPISMRIKIMIGILFNKTLIFDGKIHFNEKS